MIHSYTCSKINRNKYNRIESYTLQDECNREKVVRASELKQLIKNNKIHVDNLTLTSDNRLVLNKNMNNIYTDITRKLVDYITYNCSYGVKKDLRFIRVEDMESFSNKANSLGKPISIIKLAKHLVIVNFADKVLVISDKSFRLVNSHSYLDGSGNTIWQPALFANTTFHSIDLSGIDIIIGSDMDNMFSECKASNIIFSNRLDTTGIHSINSMFSHCENLSHIDLTMFNMENLRSANNAFSMSGIRRILVSDKFRTPILEVAEGMFESTKIENLNAVVNTMKPENLVDGVYMFYDAETELLNISGIKFKHLVLDNGMFDNIHISNFIT